MGAGASSQGAVEVLGPPVSLEMPGPGGGGENIARLWVEKTGKTRGGLRNGGEGQLDHPQRPL